MPSISPRMVGIYLVIFWVQCVVGIGINGYNQIWQRADNSPADTILQIILVSGEVGIGAATNSLLVVISAEGIMVLAEWVRKRQFAEGKEQGIEQGKAIGIAEERKRANAKLRAWAIEKGIPIEELPISGESESDGLSDRESKDA